MSDPYLGQKTLMRQFFDATLPDGAIHRPSPAGDLDGFWNGIGDNWQSVFEDLSELANVRNPNTTPMFEDLERELGITPDTTIPISARVAHLSWKMFTRGTNGAAADLQSALDVMGFGAGGLGLKVYTNDSPQPADPSNFISGATALIHCGTSAAYCGYGGTTVCGFAAGGILVVNGDIYQQYAGVIGCGNAISYCGYGPVACCGSAIRLQVILITYPSPARRQSWGFVFFVAESATYDSFGNISGLAFGSVPSNQLGALKRLVLAVKPLSSWGVLYVNAV